MIVDHTAVASAIAAKCAWLKHVVFLGIGARPSDNLIGAALDHCRRIIASGRSCKHRGRA